MALLWILLMGVAAVLVTAVIRWRFGVRRTEHRIAFPLAMVERACLDALKELGRATAERVTIDPARDDDDDGARGRHPQVYVNAFEDATLPLTRLSDGDVAALGMKAATEHRRLVLAMRAWNAVAGTQNPAERLLPTILAAHDAAQELARAIQKHELELARRTASGRILMGLVAVLPEDGRFVN